MPTELMLGDVYYSPFLLVIFLAFVITGVSAILLNKLKLSRFFYHPPSVYLAIMVIYIILIDTYLIKV